MYCIGRWLVAPSYHLFEIQCQIFSIVLVTTKVFAGNTVIKLHPGTTKLAVAFCSSSNIPQWRHSFLLTVLSEQPCKSLTFIVRLLPWDEVNPQCHWLIWRMAFFCNLSDVAGLLCCGHSYSERMNHINENHLCWGGPVAFECSKPGNTGSFKQSGWYWCDVCSHTAVHI